MGFFGKNLNFLALEWYVKLRKVFNLDTKIARVLTGVRQKEKKKEGAMWTKAC